MNSDLIENRDEALALVDADLITIGDFFLLCGAKGWDATGETQPRPAVSQVEPAGGSDPIDPKVISIAQARASHRITGKALRTRTARQGRTVAPKPGSGLYLAFTNA